jgi:unsaturated rhamnogalacturonyl hydrolase
MMTSDPILIQRVKSAMLCIQRFQWEQGCTAQAIYEYDGMTEEVIRLCEATVLRSAEDGRVGVMEKNEAVNDPAAIGETLLLAAAHTGKAYLSEVAKKLYHYLKVVAPRTKDGVLYHFDEGWAKEQIWVDAYYMVPPFLCKYGDTEEAMKQIRGLRRYLYNEENQLMSHIWDDKNKRYGRADFWGVGNGWTIAGLTRVIAMLRDQQNEDRQYLINYVTELLNGCIKYQREDGLFHDVLNNPTSFVETNVGQMLAYAIYRGVKAGYLEESYLTYADKARAAAHSMVDELGFVRGVCGMPMFNSPGVAPEGQAFFILMEAAARDYYEDLR